MAGESSVIYNQTKASFVADKWRELYGNRVKATTIWQEVEAFLYATDTNSISNAKNGHGHTTHIPLTMELKQDIEAIINSTLFPHEDWFIFRPAKREEAFLNRKKVVENYLKNIHRRNGFRPVVKTLTSDLAMYGNCFAEVVFENNTNENKVGYIGPVVKRISPYDIVMDPTATSFEAAFKIKREILTTGEFLKRAQNTASQWNKKLVNQVLEGRTTGGGTPFLDSAKNQQYVPAGFGTWDAYLKAGVVELLTYYGDIYNPDKKELLQDQKIVIADCTFELECSEIDTPTKKPYIYHAVWERKPDMLWGMGPLENVIGMNYQINHRENGKSDAMDKLLVPDIVRVGDVDEEYNDETGQVSYFAPEGGGVSEIRPDTSFLSSDLHIDRLINQSRRSVRLPGDLTGFRSAGEKTAFEVSSLADGAMRGHIHKAQDMEVQLLEPLLKAEVELAHQHLESVVEVTHETEDGLVEFLEVSPEDLNISGELIPMGARRFARKNQILSTLSQLSSTPLFQTAAPHISSKGAAKLLQELTETESHELFSENAAVMEGAEQQSLLNTAESVVVDEAQQPNLQEELLDEEIQNLQQL